MSGVPLSEKLGGVGKFMQNGKMVVALLLMAGGLSAFAAGPAERRRPARATPMTRILVPFVGEQPTLGGYLASEFYLRNIGHDTMKVWFPFPCQLGGGCGPVEPFEFPPGATLINPTYAGAGGVFMYVPAGDFGNLGYSIRVEDVSGLIVVGRVFRGVELPLVAEDRFLPQQTLLNVPASAETLKQLRVFSLSTESVTVGIAISSLEFGTDSLLHEQNLTLRAGLHQDGHDAYPSYSDIELTDLLSQLSPRAPQGRLTITVSSAPGDPPVWAFLFVKEPNDRSYTTITPGN